MYQKLFQISIVLFLVVMSIAAIAILVMGFLSEFPGPLLARDEGIAVVAGGISEKLFAYMIVAASLLIAGLYVVLRRKRFRR